MTLRLSRPHKSSKIEPTIGLINVVFLLLMFFLIAGSLVKPFDEGVRLLTLDEALDTLPEDVVSIDAGGQMRLGGENISTGALTPPEEGSKTLRLAPDQNLDARVFADQLYLLQKQGWERITIIGARVE